MTTVTLIADQMGFLRPLAWSEIDRHLAIERRDGPRYCEAIRGAREMRHDEYMAGPHRTVPHPTRGAFSWEIDWGVGIPMGWIDR